MSSGTLIASIIAAFLLGYVVSAFVGGFGTGGGYAGGAPAGPPPVPQVDSPLVGPSAVEERVKREPNDAAAWAELGNAYFDSDQYAKAIEAYSRSLELDPGNADVWTDMGIMYRRTGEFARAVESFDQAILQDSSHQMARFNKGIVLYYDLEDRVGAFAVWSELAQMNPAFRTPTGQSIVQMMNGLR